LSKPAFDGFASFAQAFSVHLRRPVRLATLVFLSASAFLFAAPSRAQEAVDTILVLGVDVSGSIDSHEFELQRQGYVKALTDKRFLNAVSGGEHQAIAVAYFEWTGPGMDAPVYECTVIRNAADARALAAKIESTPRLLYGGGTGVGEAIYFAIDMSDRCKVKADRHVIDISGDGRTNRGRRAAPARDEAVARGFTVNGLAIINEEPYLEEFYRSEVMGGQGAFVAVVNDFEAFEDAVIAKIVREISYRNEPAETHYADARR
jgi:hypothetical protein